LQDSFWEELIGHGNQLIKNERMMTGGGRMGLLETKAEFLKNTGLI
jgi:hypothetical protein